MKNSLHATFSSSTSSSVAVVPAVSVPTVSPSTVLLSTLAKSSGSSASVVLPSVLFPEFSFSQGTTFSSNLAVLHVNIRGWRSHVDELTVFLSLMERKPELIAVNETFLNKSVVVSLPGYRVVGRRDRFSAEVNVHLDNLQSWGGVLLLVSNELDGAVVEVLSSDTAERLWFLLHCDVGPVLLCVWYRPPAPGDVSAISTFEAELSVLRDEAVGTVVVGDLNCHNLRWLKFSSSVSTEGRFLQNCCAQSGLRQLVKQPTRGEYLLDLVLSDIDEITARVLPCIADHSCVLAEFSFSLDVLAPRARKMWNFRSADWSSLSEHVASLDFSFVSVESVDVATERLTDMIISACDIFISKRNVMEKVCSHPWMTERSLLALSEKHAAEGTAEYAVKCSVCSQVLKEEFDKYVLVVKKRLSCLRSGSKQFWSLSKKLLLGSDKAATVPSLKTESGSWARLPVEKANLFANTFRSKWFLPAQQQNFYSFQHANYSFARSGFLQIRSRSARFQLASLDAASATGPDGLSTTVLRALAPVLCFPFAALARRIVDTGRWPQTWKHHWICPLHKRKSRSDANNYRGLQLTSQLSKAMERLLSVHFLPQLSMSGGFGTNQFAYRRFYGARDAILFVTLSWLRALAMGNKIGLYCNDVASAFDRVSTVNLLAKLRRSGVHTQVAQVIADWLVGRHGEVIVQGSSSESFPLFNMTYQGTVWGPPLWNLYFADSPLAVRKCGFQEVIYADDLNAFREFLNNVSNDFVMSQLRRCQFELHEWGAANCVTFDSAKESFHIISRNSSFGSSFRFLGVQYDLQLSMQEAVHECSVEGHWRLSSLLRSRRFFSLRDLALHYKSQILSFVEYRTPAITHAATSHLTCLDSVQKRFLRNVGLSSFEALQLLNLAPLSTRRDIANLGIIFRATSKRGPFSCVRCLNLVPLFCVLVPVVRRIAIK